MRKGEIKSAGTDLGGGSLAMWLGIRGMRWFTPCEGCEGSDSGAVDDAVVEVEVEVGSEGLVSNMISFHLRD